MESNIFYYKYRASKAHILSFWPKLLADYYFQLAFGHKDWCSHNNQFVYGSHFIIGGDA